MFANALGFLFAIGGAAALLVVVSLAAMLYRLIESVVFYSVGDGRDDV